MQNFIEVADEFTALMAAGNPQAAAVKYWAQDISILEPFNRQDHKFLQRSKHFAYFKLFLTVFSFIFLLPTSALAQKPSPTDELHIDKVERIGIMGGNAVVEDRNTYLAGPITAIRVCYGDRIDGIRVTYGNRDGKWIGGSTGKCEEVEIKASDKVTAVRVRSGDWIEGIAFETNGSKWSKHYGESAGGETTYRSAKDGAIAYIEGRSGARVDQLTFAFGLPHRQENVVYDTVSVRDQTRVANIQRLDRKCFLNQTTLPQVGTASFKDTVKETASWDFSTTTEWGISAEIKASFGDYVEASFGTSFNQATTEAKGGNKSNDKEIVESRTVTVPPGRAIQSEFVVSKKEITIPYKYDMVHYKDRRDNVIGRKQFEGIFKGVAFTNVGIKLTEMTQCPPGSPLEILGNPTGNTPAPANSALPSTSSTNVPAAPGNANQTISRQQNSNPGGWIEPVNAQYIDSSSGSSYELVSHKLWQEFSSDGKLMNSFTQIDIDDDCIYLFDESRNVRITLDLRQYKVRYAPDMNSTPYDIYDISYVE